jgi:hypothetical protein
MPVFPSTIFPSTSLTNTVRAIATAQIRATDLAHLIFLTFIVPVKFCESIHAAHQHATIPSLLLLPSTLCSTTLSVSYGNPQKKKEREAEIYFFFFLAKLLHYLVEALRYTSVDRGFDS